jgi:SNF2 family DNA or RNA helicase
MSTSHQRFWSGLNLTSCNHLILVDPWWNPAIEEQAFDRIHRIGQKREVHIYKLIIEGSVEKRICSVCVIQCGLSSSDHFPV